MPGIKRTRNQVKSSSSSVKKHSASKSRSSKRRLNKRESKAVAKVISRDICRADSDADTVEMNVKLPEGIQVDNKVPNSQEYSIARFIGNHLSCHLMFTDCKNNNNKFYIVQGLKKGKFWFLWTRWGRVGFDGQNCLKPYTNRYTLYNEYIEKVQRKILNGYSPIEIAYKYSNQKQTHEILKNERKINSKLPKQVQNLMKFIFDTKLIDQSVEKYGYNPKKLPLGKLSKDTIVKGYSILKEIDNAIKSKAKSDKLSKLSAEFYQNIPHNFGYQNMSHFVIDTQDKLKEKLDLMDSLCDIRITAKINESAKDNTQDENELDVKYKKLKCMIEPLNPTTDEYKVLAKSLNINEVDKKKKNIKVLEIFKVSKKDEETKVPKKSDKDRKLILHGASLSRWGGILSKGIGSKADFAKTERSKFKSEPEISDKSGQSADFTRYYMSNNIGLLALCDVAVDTSQKQKHDGLGELDKIVTTRNDASKYNDSSSKQLKTLLKEKKGCCHQSGMKAYDMGDVQLKYLYKCQFI